MSSFQQNVIKHKVGLLNLAAELGNVSRACKVMGFSRDTFYRYQAAREEGGVDALIDANRRKPNPKNRVEEATESAVTAFALEQPAFGQVRVSNELRQRGIFVSPSGVRSVWLRHNLESFKKRLSALERYVAETGNVLTEAQVQALERKQDDDVAHGEIETAHPGYLGSQDTFYVGTIKGVGRIYQQTFVDTYSKWAAAKLYTTKTPITAADLLNDRVLPFFAEQGMGMIRILTDRGTEYCGKPFFMMKASTPWNEALLWSHATWSSSGVPSGFLKSSWVVSQQTAFPGSDMVGRGICYLCPSLRRHAANFGSDETGSTKPNLIVLWSGLSW